MEHPQSQEDIWVIGPISQLVWTRHFFIPPQLDHCHYQKARPLVIPLVLPTPRVAPCAQPAPLLVALPVHPGGGCIPSSSQPGGVGSRGHAVPKMALATACVGFFRDIFVGFLHEGLIFLVEKPAQFLSPQKYVARFFPEKSMSHSYGFCWDHLTRYKKPGMILQDPPSSSTA